MPAPESPSLLEHRGRCHCGGVQFSVLAPALIQALECNCSICIMTGFQHLIVPASRFTLHTGREQLTEYRFNTGTARHWFCKVCGIKAFYVPRSHPDGYSINVRCLDRDTITAVELSLFDDTQRDTETARLAHLSHTADAR